MNPSVAHLLVRLYPLAWRERYGAEYEAFLLAGHGSVRTCTNVFWSAIREQLFPTYRGTMKHPSQFQSLCVRAPWAMFGLAPLVLLAGAYFTACFILWSGWRIFLPGFDTPFVPVDGFAAFYFGAGRLLYFAAPVLVGWLVAIIAVRLRMKAVWPTVGLLLIALIGSTAQVHANRVVPGGTGHVGMGLALPNSIDDISTTFFHPFIILSLTLLPYVIWRVCKIRTQNQVP